MKINQFIKELNEFLLDTGMSKNQVAKNAGVPQSQVSDWSNGKGVRFTTNSRKVVNYIVNYRKSSNENIPDVIEEAIREILNGDKSRIEPLKNILISIREAFVRI